MLTGHWRGVEAHGRWGKCTHALAYSNAELVADVLEKGQLGVEAQPRCDTQQLSDTVRAFVGATVMGGVRPNRRARLDQGKDHQARWGHGQQLCRVRAP